MLTTHYIGRWRLLELEYASAGDPTMERRLTAVPAPQLPAKADQMQAHVATDQGGQFFTAECVDTTRAGQPYGFVNCQIGHGEGEGDVHRTGARPCRPDAGA